MTARIVIIISTSDREKARTGAMYAMNALLHGWYEEVRIFFFGPAQDLLLEDVDLQNYVKEFQAMEENPIACKFIADRDKKSELLNNLGLKVEPVGSIISNLINDGYIPMVW